MKRLEIFYINNDDNIVKFVPFIKVKWKQAYRDLNQKQRHHQEKIFILYFDCPFKNLRIVCWRVNSAELVCCHVYLLSFSSTVIGFRQIVTIKLCVQLMTFHGHFKIQLYFFSIILRNYKTVVEKSIVFIYTNETLCTMGIHSDVLPPN